MSDMDRWRAEQPIEQSYDNNRQFDVAMTAWRKREPDERMSKWRTANVALGGWMSAALDDPSVCAAMKADINAWFSAGEPFLATTPARNTSQIGEG